MLLDDLPEPVRARVSGEPAATAELAAWIERARAEMPGVEVGDAELAAYVVARVPDDASIAAYVEKLRAGDLLLAAACARGDATAIATFERRYFDEIPIAYARFRTRATVDDVRQSLRDKLFVASGGARPKIASYSGVGDLRAWFRVTVVRTLLNLATRGPKEVELKEAMLDAMPPVFEDPEIAHARSLYGAALAEAFEVAIAKLERRERQVLRYAVCDGLTVDAIGKIYGVHRATAARWVQGARERLEGEVLEAVRARIDAGDESLASIMRLLASQVEVSLRAHLETSGGPSPGG
jgi:RNA polymerase sigma-70 factor (ECF subfamily)